MMAGSEHTDNALHSQLSTDPLSPCGKVAEEVLRLLEGGKNRSNSNKEGSLCSSNSRAASVQIFFNLMAKTSRGSFYFEPQ